jgi:tetratricopeptide (TPR) repeat protein
VVLFVGALFAYPDVAASRRPTQNVEAYRFYLSGQVYEKRGPLAAAESLYRRALTLDSGFALARAHLAILYAACRRGGSRDCYGSPRLEERPVDRLEQIRTEAQGALALKPGLPEAHFAMGLYWEQREEPDRALEEYALARKGLGRLGELHAAIGRAHRARGEWQAAFDAFERALALDPNDPTSAFDLATTYSRLRRYQESVRTWDRYLALVPDAYAGMIIRGNVYLRWHGTVDTLAAVVNRLPPEERRRAWNTRVLLARIRERPAEALAALDEAPDENREASISQAGATDSRPLLRAHVYADMGNFGNARAWYDTARRYLEQRVHLRPRDFSAQVALGLAYAGLGRSEDARKAADSAMAIMPPSRTVPAGTTAMRGAAEILAQLPGHEGEAIALLDRLMQMPAGREASVPLLRIDPAWRRLRADPRFQQLLNRYSSQ